MTDTDSCEVGGTGREGFSEGPLSGNFDDGDNYENIGGDDDQEATSLIKHGND